MHCGDGGTVFHIFKIKQQRQPTAVSLTATILSGDVNSQNIPEGKKKAKGRALKIGQLTEMYACLNRSRSKLVNATK